MVAMNYTQELGKASPALLCKHLREHNKDQRELNRLWRPEDQILSRNHSQALPGATLEQCQK